MLCVLGVLKSDRDGGLLLTPVAFFQQFNSLLPLCFRSLAACEVLEGELSKNGCSGS